MQTQTAPTKQKWEFTEHSRNTHQIAFHLPTVGSEFKVLLQSDVHWDNPKCEREHFHRHLQQARAIHAPVIDNGDFFCAMQGKYDKRSSKDDLRPEHQHGNYIDRLIETAADDLSPYLDILTVRGQGNHETAILKNHETHLTERLSERLRMKGGIARTGGYTGWIRFSVTYAKNRRCSFILWYHHGHGGGGPVTRGVIQSNRTAVFVANADVVWMGHTHDAWVLPIERIALSQSNRQTMGHQFHVRTPGYKEEYQDGNGGWHVERGGVPKPTGCAWLTFRWERDGEAPRLLTPTLDMR